MTTQWRDYVEDTLSYLFNSTKRSFLREISKQKPKGWDELLIEKKLNLDSYILWIIVESAQNIDISDILMTTIFRENYINNDIRESANILVKNYNNFIEYCNHKFNKHKKILKEYFEWKNKWEQNEFYIGERILKDVFGENETFPADFCLVFFINTMTNLIDIKKFFDDTKKKFNIDLNSIQIHLKKSLFGDRNQGNKIADLIDELNSWRLSKNEYVSTFYNMLSLEADKIIRDYLSKKGHECLCCKKCKKENSIINVLKLDNTCKFCWDSFDLNSDEYWVPLLLLSLNYISLFLNFMDEFHTKDRKQYNDDIDYSIRTLELNHSLPGPQSKFIIRIKELLKNLWTIWSNDLGWAIKFNQNGTISIQFKKDGIVPDFEKVLGFVAIAIAYIIKYKWQEKESWFKKVFS